MAVGLRQSGKFPTPAFSFSKSSRISLRRIHEHAVLCTSAPDDLPSVWHGGHGSIERLCCTWPSIQASERWRWHPPPPSASSIWLIPIGSQAAIYRWLSTPCWFPFRAASVALACYDNRLCSQVADLHLNPWTEYNLVVLSFRTSRLPAFGSKRSCRFEECGCSRNQQQLLHGLSSGMQIQQTSRISAALFREVTWLRLKTAQWRDRTSP